MPLLHQSRIRKVQEEYQDYLANNKNNIIGILDQIERLKSAYEQLSSREPQNSIQPTNTASSPKSQGNNDPFAILDRDQAALQTFLDLLSNPKFDPAPITVTGYHSTIGKAVSIKLQHYPARLVQRLMFYCLMSNNNESDHYAYICDSWSNRIFHSEDLLAYFCLHVKKHITKAQTHVDQLRAENAQLTEKRDEARLQLSKLLQQLKYLQLLNANKKDLTEKAIKKTLGNILPSLRTLDNINPLADAVDLRLTQSIAKVSNIADLETIIAGLEEATAMFHLDVVTQLRSYFTKQLKKFTSKEQYLNDLLSPVNPELVATEMTNHATVVTTLKQALNKSPHSLKSDRNKTSIITQSINLISAFYSTLHKEATDLINGFKSDSLSIDDIDFDALNNPEFSEEQLQKFLKERVEAIDAATKQLEDLSQTVLKKLEDNNTPPVNTRQHNSSNFHPSVEDFPILGFVVPGAINNSLTHSSNNTSSTKQEKTDSAATAQVAPHTVKSSATEQSHHRTTKSVTTEYKAENLANVKPKTQHSFTLGSRQKKSSIIPSKEDTPQTTISIDGKSPAISIDASNLAGQQNPISAAQIATTFTAHSESPSSVTKQDGNSLITQSASQVFSANQEEQSLALPAAAKPSATTRSELHNTQSATLQLPTIPSTESAPPSVVKKNSNSHTRKKSANVCAESQQNHEYEQTHLSNNERETLSQNNIDQPQMFNISLTDKILIPHVVAVRQYQATLKNISQKIASKLVLFETASDINTEVIESLSTLKNKIDERVRESDRITITDYRDGHIYSGARNIIAQDQAPYGTRLNIGKCFIQATETCAPPVTHLGWFDWIVDKIYAVSTSIINFIYPNKKDVSYLTQDQQNDTTDNTSNNPYSFIATIKEEFETAGTEALEQIERYDNTMHAGQQQNIEYARAKGIFYAQGTSTISNQLPTKTNDQRLSAAVTNAENELSPSLQQNSTRASSLQTQPHRAIEQIKSNASAACAAGKNPHSLFAVPSHKAETSAKKQNRKSRGASSTSELNSRNNNSFTVCF